MTLDDLRAWGANVDEGLGRCMNREDIYLRLAGTIKGEQSFDRLKAALEAGNWHEAFEASHALKGVLGNLSLTPLYEPMCEICELLRPEEPVDYAALLATIDAEHEKFLAL